MPNINKNTFADINNVKTYEKLYKKGHNHNYPNINLIRLEKIFFKNDKGKCLDFGYGTGENFIFLLKKAYSMYGIETSTTAKKIVEKKIKILNIKKKYKLVKMNINANQLPFKNQFFVKIVCMSVLSLINDKKKIINLIKELERIMTPGGKLIIDINGKRGGFYKFKNINRNKKFQINSYCANDIKEFISFFNKKFNIISKGEIFYNYFNILDHEYILCLEKKVNV